jgi:predicted nucleic acid-binding protein
MTIVVDANLIAGLGLPLPYAPLATKIFDQWNGRGEHLIAPMLLAFELTTIVRKGVVGGHLRKERALPVLFQLYQSGVEIVAPTIELHQQALYWAERIGQSKAYDAQYLALASRENAPLWTADRRLASTAQHAGLQWVHWIGGWNP